uniref:Uncharacterized protein n=1 Tax=Arundo donax TaxID=35708 RepID=A0A0A9DRP6_ARUDO
MLIVGQKVFACLTHGLLSSYHDALFSTPMRVGEILLLEKCLSNTSIGWKQFSSILLWQCF